MLLFELFIIVVFLFVTFSHIFTCIPFIGVVSEELLVHGELGDRTLLFYVGVLSVVVGVARGMVPEDNFVFQPQMYLDQVTDFVYVCSVCI